MRGVLAAAAGVTGAGCAHLLDRLGALPGVHETEAVRAGMGPVAAAGWLVAAAALAWLAASTRPALVGAPAALAVAGIPELVGRGDAGAVLEPGALAGAAVQWLLLLALLALVVVLERHLGAWPGPGRAVRLRLPAPARPAGRVAGHTGPRRVRPRGPPAVLPR